MPELAQTTDGLHPPKDLFHEFSFPLTHVITRMPGGPTINRTPADLLRHVGRDVPDADIGDEARHIVALVCSDRAARRRAGLQQQCRRLAFGGPRRVGRTDVGDEPMPIIQQHVAQIRQLRLLPLALPMQHRLRISRRLVRVVAPPLAVEVDCGIPGSSGGALGAASRHRKLFRLAQASNCVPSTVKCSSESRPAARAWAWTASKKAAATSPASSRSRFLVNVVGCQTGRPYSSRRTSGTAGCS